MDNDKKLFEGMLKADGIDPVGVTETERENFRAMLDREQKYFRRLSWIPIGTIWVFALALIGLCLSEKIIETLQIPFIVVCITIMIAALIVIIKFMPGHNRKIIESNRKVQKLYRLVHGKNRGFAMVGVKNGKRVIQWASLLTFTLILWLGVSLGGAGVYYILCQRWIYSSTESPTIWIHIFLSSCLPLSFLVSILRSGLKAPLDELTEIKDKPKPPSQPSSGLRHNAWMMIVQSRLAKYAICSIIIVAVIFGINYFGGSIDGAAPAFASVMDNVRSQKWVYMFIEDRKEGTIRSEHWYSPKERKLFIKSPGEGGSGMVDLRSGEMTMYNDGKITISSPRNSEEIRKWISQRMPMIDGLLADRKKNGSAVTQRRAKYNGEDAWLYIIETRLPQGKGTNRIFQYSWLVDTKSNLPIICEHKQLYEIKRNKTNKLVTINSDRYAFDYSDSGPADIYELGVPKDAEIIDKRPSPEILELIKNINEVKARHFHTYAAIITDSHYMLPQHLDICNGKKIRDDYLELKINGSDFTPEKEKYYKEMGETFESVFKWIQKPDRIMKYQHINISDGNFRYETSEWDFDDGDPVEVKRGSIEEGRLPFYCWLLMPYEEKIVEDDYSKENGLICVVDNFENKYYYDPQKNYYCVRAVNKDGQMTREIIGFGKTLGGILYPKTVRMAYHSYNEDRTGTYLAGYSTHKIYVGDFKDSMNSWLDPKKLPNYVDHKAITKQWVENKEAAVDPNDTQVVEYTGFTPLHMAIFRKDVDKVKQCLRDGADVEPDSDTGASPMELAVAAGSLELVKLLGDRGADFISNDEQKRSCLGLAVKNGAHDIFDYMLGFKVNVNAVYKEGNTPLHYAAYNGDIPVIKKLLARGAKIDVLNKSGKSPLAKGVNKYISEIHSWPSAGKDFIDKHQETIALLVKQGANINQHYTADDKSTILLWAVSVFHDTRNAEQQLEFVKLLLELGADPNLMTRYRSTLYMAFKEQRYDMAKVLLDNGADPWLMPEHDSFGGGGQVHFLYRAKQWKRKKMYDLLYPYMKERLESTNKSMADSVRKFMKASLANDATEIKKWCIGHPHYRPNVWQHWSKKVHNHYTGHEKLLDKIQPGWFTVDGFGDAFVPLPKGGKSECIGLSLFLHPDGTWKCIGLGEMDKMPEPDNMRINCTGYGLEEFTNLIYEQYGQQEKWHIRGYGTTSKGDCVTGDMVFEAGENELRVSFTQRRGRLVLTPKYVKEYDDDELNVGNITLGQKDKKMEVRFEPLKCTIEREGKKYAVTLKKGKVVFDDGEKIITADKIVVGMPEVVIESVESELH